MGNFVCLVIAFAVNRIGSIVPRQNHRLDKVRMNQPVSAKRSAIDQVTD